MTDERGDSAKYGWFFAFVESLLLFGAFFCLLPYIPSNEMADLPYAGAAAIACVLFAASRILRWGSRWPMVVIELPLFAAFAWALHVAIEIIHDF